jgi:hypothetical protein
MALVWVACAALWEIGRGRADARARVGFMKVTFTKNEGRRYSVSFAREHGPALAPRNAPGYDPHLPHDLVHLLVEKQFGIRLGVFGQIAAGGEGVFRPAPNDRSGRTRRTTRRLGDIGRGDMARSERLVNMIHPLWELRSGRKPNTQPVVDPRLATPFDISATMERFDEYASQWEALRPGESITVEWPEDLTYNAGGSTAGRARVRDHAGRRV